VFRRCFVVAVFPRQDDICRRTQVCGRAFRSCFLGGLLLEGRKGGRDGRAEGREAGRRRRGIRLSREATHELVRRGADKSGVGWLLVAAATNKARKIRAGRWFVFFFKAARGRNAARLLEWSAGGGMADDGVWLVVGSPQIFVPIPLGKGVRSVIGVQGVELKQAGIDFHSGPARGLDWTETRGREEAKDGLKSTEAGQAVRRLGDWLVRRGYSIKPEAKRPIKTGG